MKKLFCLMLLVSGFAVASMNAQSCSKAVSGAESKKCCANPHPGCKETGTAAASAGGTVGAAALAETTAAPVAAEAPAKVCAKGKACCAGKKMTNGTASAEKATPRLVAAKKESTNN